MAKLTAKKRRSIPASKFAGPDRSYPVDTPARARAAAGFAAMHHASPAIKAKIRKLSKRLGEQHGPIDDMPSAAVKVAAHTRRPPSGYGGGSQKVKAAMPMKHQAQMGTPRALGGDCG